MEQLGKRKRRCIVYYERKIGNRGNRWISWGYSKRFGLGFSIDKYSINIDFLCFWIGIEL